MDEKQIKKTLHKIKRKKAAQTIEARLHYIDTEFSGKDRDRVIEILTDLCHEEDQRTRLLSRIVLLVFVFYWVSKLLDLGIFT